MKHFLASCRKIDFLRFSLSFPSKWRRKLWKRTFLEFSCGSVAAEAIAEVAAGALAAHFSRVFTWFCGRGGYRRSGRGSRSSALFSSFHVVLWPRKLSQKWPQKPWQRTFLEFLRILWPRKMSEKHFLTALGTRFVRFFHAKIASEAQK